LTDLTQMAPGNHEDRLAELRVFLVGKVFRAGDYLGTYNLISKFPIEPAEKMATSVLRNRRYNHVCS